MLTPVPPQERDPLRPLFEDFTGLHGIIDAVLEGTLGDAYADDPTTPRVARIELDFNAIAGDPTAPAAGDALRRLDSGDTVVAPDSWTNLLMDIRHVLRPTNRFAFSPGPWDRSTLAALRESLPEGFVLERITQETVSPFEALADSLIYNFDSPADFLARGVGFGVRPKGSTQFAAGCSSFAISSRTLEFEVQTHPNFRRRGLALVTSSRMIEHCLDNALEPAWDAAHEGSAVLAERLGFINRRSYTAYRLG